MNYNTSENQNYQGLQNPISNYLNNRNELSANLANPSTIGANQSSLKYKIKGIETANEEEIAIGEQVTLSIPLKEGESIVKILWTVPSTVVKTYLVVRRKSAKPIPLVMSDLTSEKLIFHWVAGGKQKVSARVVIDRFDYQEEDKIFSKEYENKYEFPFDVKAPKIILLKSDAAKKPEVYKQINDLSVFGYSSNEGRKPGISWDWKISLPKDHDGLIKDVQIIFGERIKTLKWPNSNDTETSSWEHPSVTKGTLPRHWQLDMGVLDDLKGSDADPKDHLTEVTYSSPGYYGTDIAFPKRIMGGKSFRNNQTWDSPSSSLSSLMSEVSIHDLFKYFVMYKPDKKDAIWVPVAMAEWFWKGVAIKKGNRHILKSGSGGMTKVTNPTKEFPTYQTNVNNNE